MRRRRSRGARRVGRRLRRLWRDRPRLVILIGAGALVFLGLLWSLWTAWSAARHLDEVADQAEIMRAAIVRGDVDGARRALEAYQEAADAAADDTSGATWWVFGKVPFLGDDADGVAVVAEVLADIGRDGLPPVVDAADSLTADSFQPRDGVFPVAQIRAMEEPARSSERAFDAAAGRLAEVDSSGFVGPVGTRFDTLSSLVEDARSTLDSTYRASRLMPTLLGEKKARYFLMVLQNNAEIRSSGGLPGALSLVRAKDGKIDIVEQEDMSAIGEQTADLKVKATGEERRLFGANLAGVAVNATLTPDFERSAGLIRARWERATDRRIDGVILVDPVTVSYLLRGTGNVAVPGYPPVTTGNVVRAVEHEIYLATADRDEQSDYQRAVAKAVFDAFAAGGGDSVEAVRGLATGVAEGRVRLHFFDRAAQQEIAGTRIAGEFSTRAGTVPAVGIYLNDAGPTKMQYFLRYDASLFARSCEDDGQRLAGSIELSSDAGGDLPPSITGEGYPGVRVEPGEQLIVVYLTAPVGGEVESLAIEGQKVPKPVVQTFAGRSVATVGVELAPQESQRLEFEMTSGPGQDGDPRLEVTPGAFPGSSNATVRSACDIR